MQRKIVILGGYVPVTWIMIVVGGTVVSESIFWVS